MEVAGDTLSYHILSFWFEDASPNMLVSIATRLGEPIDRRARLCNGICLNMPYRPALYCFPRQRLDAPRGTAPKQKTNRKLYLNTAFLGPGYGCLEQSTCYCAINEAWSFSAFHFSAWCLHSTAWRHITIPRTSKEISSLCEYECLACYDCPSRCHRWPDFRSLWSESPMDL